MLIHLYRMEPFTAIDVTSERSFILTCAEIMENAVRINGLVRYGVPAMTQISMKFANRSSALCPVPEGRRRRHLSVAAPGGRYKLDWRWDGVMRVLLSPSAHLTAVREH